MACVVTNAFFSTRPAQHDDEERRREGAAQPHKGAQLAEAEAAELKKIKKSIAF